MREQEDQLALFSDGAKAKSMLQAVDEINDRYGDFTVTWAAYLEAMGPPSVISPAWRPSGVRNVDIKN